jgi:hypothetical protein
VLRTHPLGKACALAARAALARWIGARELIDKNLLAWNVGTSMRAFLLLNHTAADSSNIIAILKNVRGQKTAKDGFLATKF